jgi:hypothetical protein
VGTCAVFGTFALFLPFLGLSVDPGFEVLEPCDDVGVVVLARSGVAVKLARREEADERELKTSTAQKGA